jgi:hypothetical protein
LTIATFRFTAIIEHASAAGTATIGSASAAPAANGAAKAIGLITA